MPDVIQQIFKRLAVPLPDAPEATTATAATDACLAQLPTDLLHHLLRLGGLTARDLSALACACRRLASIAAAHVPSLLPKLYEHQRASLRWMRACEGRAGAEGAPPRGGVLADEPGLGKTVTVLSLVLKTAGARPAQLPEDVDDGAADKWASYDVVDRERWALAVLNHASRPPPRVWELIAPLARTFHTLDAFEGACRAAAARGFTTRPTRRSRGPSPTCGGRMRSGRGRRRRARAAPSSSPRARCSTTGRRRSRFTSTAAAAPAAPRRSVASPSRVEACTSTRLGRRRCRTRRRSRSTG